MNAYRIVLDGMKFQLIETQTDGGVCFVGRFTTVADARMWLGDYLRRVGQPQADLIEEYGSD